MNLICIKFSMFTKNKSIKTKRETDGKFCLYPFFIIECGFKKLRLLMRKN